MIASAIAYVMCAIFVVVGIVAMVEVLSNKLPKEKHLPTFIVAIGSFGIAWGCAYIGGI